MQKDQFKNVTFNKIIRAIILFFSIYFVMKYGTIGKIGYDEIVMVASTGIIVQVFLDIYRPIVSVVVYSR